MKDEHGLKVFPGRTDEKVEVVQSKTGESLVERGPQVIKVIIPETPTAKGRTIRFHESQHLNHTPKTGRKALKGLWLDTQMGIEDILLHTKYMPLDVPRSVLRDEKATALQDLRIVRWYLEASKMLKMDIPEKTWNVLMIMAVRSKAILSRKEVKSVKERKFFTRSMEMKLNNVVRLTRWGFHARAGRAFQKLLKRIPNPMGSGSSSGRSGLWGGPEMSPKAQGKKVTQPSDATVNFPMAPVGDFKPLVPKGDHILPPEEEISTNIMPVHHLDLDRESIEISHTRDYRFQSSGSMPSPFKLARASFSPVSSLFKVKMRKTVMGASFLFDFSGSMGITGQHLALIMEDVPAATIGFYSGHGLTIYAEGGKHSSETNLESDGGNDWDHQALLWLIKQPKPWFFISDEHFSEDRHYDPGQALRATRFMTKRRKDITVYHSYPTFVHAMKTGQVLQIIKGSHESNKC